MDAVAVPVLVLHGRQPLVPMGAARQVARAQLLWDYEEWTDAGHLPQLRMPERVIERIGKWLDVDGRGPSRAGHCPPDEASALAALCPFTHHTTCILRGRERVHFVPHV